MNISRKTITLCALFILNGSLLYALSPHSAGAAKPEPGPPHNTKHPRPPIFPPLELLRGAGVAEDAISALKELQFEHRKKQISLRAEVKLAELEWRRLMDSADAVEAEVMAAVDVLHQARGEMFKEEMAARWGLRSLLGQNLYVTLQQHHPPPRPHANSRRPKKDDGPAL